MRFKKLRTVPNLFIANMAMIDLLNAVINMPLYILYDVLQVLSTMRGKAIAFTITALHVLFSHLSPLFMIVVIAADRDFLYQKICKRIEKLILTIFEYKYSFKLYR